MKTLRLLLGDQLSHTMSSLADIDPACDFILMAEVKAEGTYVRHHKQKIVLVLSAMRHFAAELIARGFVVDYVSLDDPNNSGTLEGELHRAIRRHGPDRVVITEPGEWRLWQAMLDWRESLPVPLIIRPDDRFIASRDEFAAWAKGRKTYRMEFFYREMRRKTALLMDGAEPVGGQWNFDSENRKRLPGHIALPSRLRFLPDAMTKAVIALVEQHFGDHFGTLEAFGWPVTRDQALAALDHFIEDALPFFGDFQDAMRRGEDFLFHGLLSTSLNIGLLSALEVARAAERAYLEGRAPLNAAEGLIRQVIGWREFIRGLYWNEMPGYAAANALGANRALPHFFWSGETELTCLAEVIRSTRDNAYAHHIQRLMITGNFALLAGISPREIEEWYLIVYADAFDWVELPNVHGMVMFADGGLLASKPYAASGAYIDRMSDYCAACRYDPALKSGPDACPFNPLYWNFLIENEAHLAHNPRMAMPYRNLARFSPERRAEISREAQYFLDQHAPMRDVQ
jgi:deoxyribodipyrimidine photolyase-related protein